MFLFEFMRFPFSPRPQFRIVALGLLCWFGGWSASAASAQSAPATSGAIISEFRFRGPGGSTDEFVEIHNTTGSPLNISGWKIQTNAGTKIAPAFRELIVPQNSIIAPLGHFLLTGAGYSLGRYTTGDAALSGDSSDDSGVALWNAQNPPIREDAVGFAASSDILREGSGLVSAPTANGETAFARDFINSEHKNTPLDSTPDFLFLSAQTLDGGDALKLAPIAGTAGDLTPQRARPRRAVCPARSISTARWATPCLTRRFRPARNPIAA